MGRGKRSEEMEEEEEGRGRKNLVIAISTVAEPQEGADTAKGSPDKDEPNQNHQSPSREGEGGMNRNRREDIPGEGRRYETPHEEGEDIEHRQGNDHIEPPPKTTYMSNDAEHSRTIYHNDLNSL